MRSPIRPLSSRACGFLLNVPSSTSPPVCLHISCLLMLCFTPLAQVLDPKAVPINYVVARSSDLSRTHSLDASLTVDTTGQEQVEVGESGPSPLVVAHAALMITAFAGLMPLGVILARHKWIFGKAEVGGAVLAGCVCMGSGPVAATQA